MATTPGGINFEELEDSPKLHFGARGCTAVRMFKVPWANYEAFVEELMGVSLDFAGAVNLTPGIPFPGNRTNLFCEDIDVEPFGGENAAPTGTAVTTLASGTNTYDNGARITARYAQNAGDSNNSAPTPVQNTYLTYEGKTSAEYFTVASRAWKWQADNAPVPDDVPVGLLSPVSEYTITWHRVTRPPWATINSAMGKVNSDTFSGLLAGTLLFTGCDSVPTFYANRQILVWQLTYHFRYKADGWNFFFRSDIGAWREIVAKVGGARPYTSAAFANLFVYG
jgi:hypothetical protein